MTEQEPDDGARTPEETYTLLALVLLVFALATLLLWAGLAAGAPAPKWRPKPEPVWEGRWRWHSWEVIMAPGGGYAAWRPDQPGGGRHFTGTWRALGGGRVRVAERPVSEPAAPPVTFDLSARPGRKLQ